MPRIVLKVILLYFCFEFKEIIFKSDHRRRVSKRQRGTEVGLEPQRWIRADDDDDDDDDDDHDDGYIEANNNDNNHDLVKKVKKRKCSLIYCLEIFT